MIIEMGWYALGFINASYLWWRVHRSFIARLGDFVSKQAMAETLERRRVATDSGRDTVVPALAGEATSQGDLFSTRPGMMELHHIAIKNPRNAAKILGIDMFSGIVEDARVERDQDNEKQRDTTHDN